MPKIYIPFSFLFSHYHLGACIISRFASWLSAIWVSLQAVLALGYIGMFASNAIPFRECAGTLKLNMVSSYY